MRLLKYDFLKIYAHNDRTIDVQVHIDTCKMLRLYSVFGMMKNKQKLYFLLLQI